MKYTLILIVSLCGFAAPAYAQEPLPRTDEAVVPTPDEVNAVDEPKVNETPDPVVVSEPIKDPTPVEAEPAEPEPKDAKQVDPERKRAFYSNTTGIGGGLMWITGPDLNRDPVGTLSLEFRKSFVVAGLFGLEWLTSITVHDWETIGNVYKWYNKGDKDDVTLKYTLLFPGLLIAPFFGSNLASGFGLVVYTAPQAPSFYFDAGGQLAIFLRPSDPDLKFDIGFGAYGGLGFDFSAHVGLGLRVLWSPAAIHSLINRSKRNVVTGSAMLNFKF